MSALTSLAELSEFARELVGKVKLAYLDPPFNTQQSFLQYDDALEHSVWLTVMRDRLVQIRKLLAAACSRSSILRAQLLSLLNSISTQVSCRWRDSNPRPSGYELVRPRFVGTDSAF